MHPDPELLALLALGEDVEPAERAHVAACPGCRVEVAELTQLVGIGRTSGSAPPLQAPPARVWEATAAELGFTLRPSDAVVQTNGSSVQPPSAQRSAAPSDPRSAPRRARPSTDDDPSRYDSEPPAVLAAAPSRRGRRALALVLAAVSALVVGFAIGNVVSLPTRSETVARTQLAALPSWPDSNGTAVVEQDRDGHRDLVITMHTPQPVDGSREVWLINRTVTSMFSLGYMRGTTYRLVIPDGLDLSAYPIVDVSREPFGDTDPAHSLNSIVRGTLAQ